MDSSALRRRWRPVDVLERWLPRPAARVVGWARSDEFLLTAASLAFFALVSLPPTALIAFWIAGSVAGDERVRQLGDQLAAAVPQQASGDTLLVQLVDVATALGWTSLVAAVWPATAYGAGLARAFDRLTPSGRRRMDGLRGRALVVLLIALLPLLVLGALLLVVLGPRIAGEAALVRLLALAAAGALALVTMTAILGLLYALFSPTHVGAGAAARGGAWAAAAVTLISVGYAVYLRVGANFEERYGSSAFAAVVLLALWLYLANGALIVGYKVALQHADARAWHEREWPSGSRGD